MKNYGYVNNKGEVKQIQLNTYDGTGYYVGIDRNGFAYVYENALLKKLTKNEVASYLGLTSDQVSKLIKARGKIEFGSSREGDGIIANVVSKESKKSNVFSKRAKKTSPSLPVEEEEMDIPREREKSPTSRSAKRKDKVSLKKEAKTTALQNNKSEVPSLEEANSPKVSLKNRVKHIENNYVTKEQLIAVVEAITKGE